MSIYPTQTRAVDPYASYNSNIVNILGRLVSNGEDIILPSDPIDVSQLSATSVRCSTGKCVKDDVYIEFTATHDVDFTDPDNYLEVGGGALDSTGYYYLVLQYVYVKSKPAPVASVLIIKPDQRLTLYGSAHILLKVLNVDSGGSITELLDYDPENPSNRRKVGAAKALSIINVDSNYTASANDGIIISSGNITITLPDADTKFEIGIFKSDTGTTLTILPDSGGDTITGDSSMTMTTQYSAAVFMGDGVDTVYTIKGSEIYEAEFAALSARVTVLEGEMNAINNLDSTSPIIIALNDTREDLEDLVNNEETAKNYLRTNQSFLNMYYDDFVTLTKTNVSYQSKVDIDDYKMTPGNGGEWRSATWTAGVSATTCKLVWRSENSFDHNIQISANNGSNWTTISSGGATTNMDQEVAIANTGTSIILRISGGTQGSLLDYTLLIK